MSSTARIDWVRGTTRGPIPLGVTSVRAFNIKSDGVNYDDLTNYTALFTAKASFDDQAGPVLWSMTESNGITLQLGTSSVDNLILTFDVTELAAQSVVAATLQYQLDLITPTPASVPNRTFEGNLTFTWDISP